MTGPLSSLTNRIFVATALLVLVSTGVAIYRVNASLTARAEADLQSGLDEAASLVDELSRTQFADSAVKASLIANLPVLMAAASTKDPPTVQPIADNYQATIRADLFIVMSAADLNTAERLLAQSGRLRLAPADVEQLLAACRASADGTAFWLYPDAIVHAMAIPMPPVAPEPAALGTLLVGFSLDRPAAERFKALTNSDIVLAVGDRAIASTLDPDAAGGIPALVRSDGSFRGWIGPEEYVGRAQPLGAGKPDEPRAIVLRSRTQHLQFLPPLRWQIALTGLGAVLIATLLGYAIARTVTRPVRAVTASMREIAATGDLGRAVPGSGRWDDEDARVLSTTFAQLTGALRRFQREAAQRERLSSLGRLSTVIAHEIRNPLMIIKSAVRSLRRHASSDVAAVAQSIDEEVTRLNNVVSGVLDFARPIDFALAPADLVEISRDASQAAMATAADVPITLDPAVTHAPAVIDAERLRAVLVNVLGNAQQAVRATRAAPPPAVTVGVSSGRTGWWRIEVLDRGEGISPEHLSRVFEPFFTTRRTGSGLGLAIARNVVEGLGGTIALESRPGAGTRVRIELPSAPADAAAAADRAPSEVRA
jgi:signal transduction histidine kinase